MRLCLMEIPRRDISKGINFVVCTQKYTRTGMYRPCFCEHPSRGARAVSCDVRQGLQQENTDSIPVVVTVCWALEHSASMLEIDVRLPRGERKAGVCPDSARREEGVGVDVAPGTGIPAYQVYQVLIPGPGIKLSGICFHECYRIDKRYTPGM